jgi:hypothetical protein
MRKEEEIHRAMKAFQETVQFADNLDRGLVQNSHNGSDNYRDQPSVAPKRWPRPPVPIRTTITQYAESELIKLLKWIASDDQLRTDDEIIDEMTATLGFSRRGPRIEAALRRAIMHWRQRSGLQG